MTPRQRRPPDRRGDEDGRSRRARRDRADVSGGRRGGDRSRHAADPQSGHRRRQPQSAAALLVLPQRRVRLLQEGREHLLLAGGREPVPRHLRRRPDLHRASVQPGGAVRRLRRDVPSVRAERRAAGAGGRVLHDADAAERAAGKRAAAERAADARDPAGARQREERPLRSALQDVARLADRLRDGAAGDERHRPCSRRAS